MRQNRGFQRIGEFTQASKSRFSDKYLSEVGQAWHRKTILTGSLPMFAESLGKDWREEAVRVHVLVSPDHVISHRRRVATATAHQHLAQDASAMCKNFPSLQCQPTNLPFGYNLIDKVAKEGGIAFWTIGEGRTDLAILFPSSPTSVISKKFQMALFFLRGLSPDSSSSNAANQTIYQPPLYLTVQRLTHVTNVTTGEISHLEACVSGMIG